MALGALLVVGALAWQQHNIRKLRIQLETLQQAGATVPEADSPPDDSRPARITPTALSSEPPPVVQTVDADLAQRVTALEASLAGLNSGAEHLMDRGLLPPSETKIAEWRAKFMDSTLSSRDRLTALRMLRRNGQFDDSLAQTAANWLATSTDPNETRGLLGYLRGEDSPVLKSVTLSLATTSTDPKIREGAVSNLREYTDDPQVEAALWQLVSSDSSGSVRSRAEDALRRIPMTEARASTLKMDAINQNVPLEKRLASLRLLQSGKQDISDVAQTLARSAQAAADEKARLEYIQAFDDVNHPEFMLPLVNSAQDQSAEVRLRAADALVDYRSDPTIAEWLKYLAESDPDPRVRKEASRVFREDGRRDSRWGR